MEFLMTYILPIVIFAAIGAAAGGLLILCSKLFFVETDETVARLTEALPSGNCGACGYSGCESYAVAVAKGEAKTNLCKVGGDSTAKVLAEIMGTGALETVREVAVVRCNGCNDAVEDRYIFAGTQTCAATERFYQGKKNCRSGCDGLGDCVAVCEYNAISIQNGVAVVNPDRCKACGKCASVCPNKLIAIVPEGSKYTVLCSSRDTGKATREICKNGCIGCKICEKKCPVGAIAVSDNHAVIDHSKCTNCGACAQACPQKCIK